MQIGDISVWAASRSRDSNRHTSAQSTLNVRDPEQHRAVSFAIAQLSCLLSGTPAVGFHCLYTVAGYLIYRFGVMRISYRLHKVMESTQLNKRTKFGAKFFRRRVGFYILGHFSLFSRTL